MANGKPTVIPNGCFSVNNLKATTRRMKFERGKSMQKGLSDFLRCWPKRLEMLKSPRKPLITSPNPQMKHMCLQNLVGKWSVKVIHRSPNP